ncbi:hypothetical protein NDU88_001933 [Pleurodeles waltl]|uniref:Uncharacterized protein n=1 Tax=Pleurodeles waltl TaxID=8319 RepID=A0AAV7W310_PLEWA|nr:hypothetical protein NDU88_001933 [Pleurodeles waltl]
MGSWPEPVELRGGIWRGCGRRCMVQVCRSGIVSGFVRVDEQLEGDLFFYREPVDGSQVLGDMFLAWEVKDKFGSAILDGMQLFDVSRRGAGVESVAVLKLACY